ncbi:MAG: hypothetical protein QXM75_02515, partial [Candidatus Diapherotrites archaeon]
MATLLSSKRKFLNLLIILSFLGLLGLFRNLLEVVLCIKVTPDPKWYSFDFDVLLVMLVFPIYLCFFGAFMLHFISKKFGENVKYDKIFSYLFQLQFLHIVIPFVDYIGLKAEIPALFFMPFPQIESYFNPILPMTFGIVFAWILTAFIIIFVFVQVFKVKIWKSVTILMISFSTLYFPIYHMFPAFNTIFNTIFMPGT